MKTSREILFLFFKIKTFEEILKISDSNKFLELKKKIDAIERSFREVGINNRFSMSERIPKHIWDEYNLEFNKVYEEVIEHLKELVEEEDYQQIINFLESLDFSFFDILNKTIKTKDGEEEIELDFAENFRFKNKRNTFSLFTLPKENRDIVVPQDANSFIFAVDFRQFEFRTNLLLLGKNELLKEDNLYESVGKEMGMAPEDAKLKIISSLYSPEPKDEAIKAFLNRDVILSKIEKDVYWFKGQPVYVNYDDHNGKKIHSITQSISQYYYIRKLKEISDLLEFKISQFIFPLHDSMIFSIHESEMDLMEKIVGTLTNHVYKLKCYIGPNFRDAEEIK